MAWFSVAVALNLIASSSAPVWTVVVEDDSETGAEWVTSIHAAFTDLDEELTDMSFDLPSAEEQANLQKMFNCEAMNSACVGKMARMRKASYCLHIGLTKVDGNVQMTYSVVDDQGSSHFTVKDYVLDEAARVGARLLASKVRADLHGISPTVLVLETESERADVFVDGENMGSAPLVDWSIKAGKHYLTVSDDEGTVYSGSVDVKAGEITRIKAEELETIGGNDTETEETSSGQNIALNEDDLSTQSKLSAEKTEQPIAAFSILGVGIGSAALGSLLYGSSWAVNMSASSPSDAEKEAAGGLTSYSDRRDTSIMIISGLLVSSGFCAVAGFLGSAVGAGMLVSHYSASE